MRKKILEKRLARLNDKKNALAARANASQDANEVRSINEELSDLNAEIEETQAEIDAITAEEAEAEERNAAAQAAANENREMPPANAHHVNGGIVASFGQTTKASQTRENADPFATLEYRQAFMRYAQTGHPRKSLQERRRTG